MISITASHLPVSVCEEHITWHANPDAVQICPFISGERERYELMAAEAASVVYTQSGAGRERAGVEQNARSPVLLEASTTHF